MAKYMVRAVGKNEIKYLREGHGAPLLFLHGITVRPHNYKKLISRLARNYEVISPDMYGVHYLKEQPKSIAEYAEMTHDFCNDLKLGKHFTAGHSLGAAVGSVLADGSSDCEDLVLMSPVMPCGSGIIYLAGRTAYLGARHMTGIAGGLSSIKLGLSIIPDYFKNFLKAPIATRKLLLDVRDFSYERLEIKQPALMLYGEKDEFFTLDDKVEQEIRKGFCRLKILKYPGFCHNWPFFNPDIAAREIKGFCK